MATRTAETPVRKSKRKKEIQSRSVANRQTDLPKGPAEEPPVAAPSLALSHGGVVETWTTQHNLIFQIPLRGVDIQNFHGHIQGQTLSIKLSERSELGRQRQPEALPESFAAYQARREREGTPLQENPLPTKVGHDPEAVQSFLKNNNLKNVSSVVEHLICTLPLPPTVDVNCPEAFFNTESEILTIKFWNTDADPSIRASDLRLAHDNPPGQPFPVDIVRPDSDDVRHFEQSHEQQMAQADNIVFKDGTLFKDAHPYRPLPLAAQLGQAPRQTVRDWIKNKTEFQGRPLQTYYLEPLDRYFVSEESIQRMATRFVKWRDGKAAGPAGPVTIGKTKDHVGFLSTSESARILGVSARTAWLWASQAGKAPTDRPIDVIKCTTSDHFYIREKDVYDLKKSIPRSGLQRGRRPQGTKAAIL
jgi:hypothetical protein